MPMRLRIAGRHYERVKDDTIIRYLLDAKGYISGEEMARELRISRTAVWNHISSLKKLGFVIESHPHLGYRCVSLPDRLLPVLLAKGLSTNIIGKKIFYYERASSTNEEAEKLARAGEPEGAVVVAEEQTSGRGRVGREWHSLWGKGIYLSVILRPALPPARISFLTLFSAAATAEAVKRCSGVKASVKWPNDVLISGKKASGILTELGTEADRMNYAIVGIGINVNHDRSDLSKLPAATSLKIETGKAISRLEMAKSLLSCMDSAYSLLMGEKYDEIVDRWLAVSDTVGKRVRVESFTGERLEGVATGLDEDGCLLLRIDGGMTKRVTGGDVSIL